MAGVHKPQSPCCQDEYIFTVPSNVILTLIMQLSSHHNSGAYNFEVAVRFLEKCAPVQWSMCCK